MKLVLEDTKFTIDQDLQNLLNASPGDRLDIQYMDIKGNLVPTIGISEGGNKLTKSNTVSYRGEKRNMLARYGTEFGAEDIGGGLIVLHGDGQVVYTTVRKAVQERTIDLQLLLDKQYNLNKFEYEL